MLKVQKITSDIHWRALSRILIRSTEIDVQTAK